MKAFNYTIMILGMLLMLSFGGIEVGTNVLSQIGLTSDAFNFGTSTFQNFIFGTTGVLILGLGASLVVGFLTKSATENYAILPFIVSILAVFLQGFTGIIIYSIANNPPWITNLILLILVPVSVGYSFSLVEFFRGTD